MSLKTFIAQINESLQQAFASGKLYGLSKTVAKTTGTVTEILPVLDGTETYVGIDDVNAVIGYHKASNIQSLINKNSGFGDSQGDIHNVYTNNLIVFVDSDKVKMEADEFATLVQLNFPDRIKVENYKTVFVRVQNIILNSMQIYRSEYGDMEYKLKDRQNLISINYQIESVFDKNCFDKCP